jgi:hypothetical protein
METAMIFLMTLYLQRILGFSPLATVTLVSVVVVWLGLRERRTAVVAVPVPGQAREELAVSAD